MRARRSLNLVLLATVAALGWLAWRGGGVSDPAPGLPVTALRPAAVTRIGIERDREPAVVLERTGESWRMASPLAMPADAFRVQALLGLVAARSAEGFRAAGNDLAQFGLDPPRALLRFDDVEIAVGNTEPISARRYLMSDDQVHLLEDRWFSQIFGDATAWVDPSPLPDDAKPVRITLPDAQWRLVGGSWHREPHDAASSADVGPTLAQSWRQARALAVQTRDPSLPWREHVALGLADGRELTFEIARPPEALFLGRPDLGLQYRFLARQGRVLLAQD